MQVSPIVPASPLLPTADSLQPEKTAAAAPGGQAPATATWAAKPFEPAPPLRPTLQDRIDVTRCLLHLRV